MRYNWNWEILITDPYFQWIVSGFSWTIAIASAAWVIAFALGSAIGIARTSKTTWIRVFASAYVELFRNVPLLVQMFLWYFVLPEVVPDSVGYWLKRGMPLPEVTSAITCLGLYTACRVAEQVRAGINSVPKGQTFAGLASGLTRVQVYTNILLPISYRTIVPPLTSEFLSIFKNSSLALTIGVLEMTAQSRQITEYTFQGFEAFTVATVLYLSITLFVTFAMRAVEGKTRIPGMISLGTK